MYVTSSASPLHWSHRQYRDPLCPVEQVFNRRGQVDLPAASDAPAEAVRAGWLPKLPGQEVPLTWEAVRDGCPCDDC